LVRTAEAGNPALIVLDLTCATNENYYDQSNETYYDQSNHYYDQSNENYYTLSDIYSYPGFKKGV